MTRSREEAMEKKPAKTHKRAPTKAARLTRVDYAVAVTRGAHARAAAAEARSFDVVIVKPLQVGVTMQASYAAELLRQLRAAGKPRRGECQQITVDCPVGIVMDAATLKSLINALEAEIG